MYLISKDQYDQFHELPQTEAVRLLPFDAADVLLDDRLGYPAVVVSGTKPFTSMNVWLQPRFFVDMPDYWRIEVVGSIPFGPMSEGPGHYFEALPLDGLVGTKGIEIVGAHGSKIIDIDPSQQVRGRR